MTEDLKKFINSVFIKQRNEEITLIDIKWEEFKKDVETLGLVNESGYINMVMSKKQTPVGKLTHNCYRNDYKPKSKDDDVTSK